MKWTEGKTYVRRDLRLTLDTCRSRISPPWVGPSKFPPSFVHSGREHAGSVKDPEADGVVCTMEGQFEGVTVITLELGLNGRNMEILVSAI